MIAIINLILGIVVTILFSINQGFMLDFSGILYILLTFLVSLIAVGVVLLIFFLIFVFVTEKINPKAMWKHRIVKVYSTYIFRFLNRVKLVVTGLENLPEDNNFVVYSNHIEYSDPIFILQIYKNNPIGFVAKEPLFRFFGLRQLMYGIGCLPISKFADRSALKTILKTIDQVKGGQPMGIFPEGKRTYSNDIIDFKPGAFRVAQKAKADISPVCLYNMHDMAKKRFLPVKVYMHILPIYKYEEFKDLDSIELSNNVYKMINDQMNKYKNN